MIEVLAGLFILVLLLCVGLNFFNIPGNWINIFFLALWNWIFDFPGGWLFFLGLIALAGLAELIEFVSQLWGSKKYGGSKSGGWGAFIGALAGAILGTPFLFGLGAVLGAVAGAFLGSLIMEIIKGRSWSEALFASKGAMWGRVFGFVAKIGLGMVILSLSVPRVWP